MLSITAGKVPGGVADLQVSEGTTILEAVKMAAKADGESRGLGRPSFEVQMGDYQSKGQLVVDVPQVNGEFAADYIPTTRRWENIRWNTACSNGDVILVIPKIQGAQFIVSVTMEGWESPRKVAVFEPGDPEGGTDAGTVSQALSAAGIRVSETDIIIVNDGEEVYPADLSEHLVPGAEIFIHPAGYEFAGTTPTTAPAPTEAEVLATPGTDPTALRDAAEEMFSKADEKETEAAELAGQARELKQLAAAHEAKAEAIDAARDQFDTAKARLTELGVFHTYSKAEAEVMTRTALRAILRGKGLKPGVTMGKSDLVKWVLALQ